MGFGNAAETRSVGAYLALSPFGYSQFVQEAAREADHRLHVHDGAAADAAAQAEGLLLSRGRPLSARAAALARSTLPQPRGAGEYSMALGGS